MSGLINELGGGLTVAAFVAADEEVLRAERRAGADAA